MKLLGWMHRKLKHNCNEAVKNRTTTAPQTSFDDDHQKCHADPTYQNNIKELSEEKPALNELFHGFLAIGTLGCGSEAEAFNTDIEPPTPTFPTSFDDENDVTHETTQITDQDLKLITKELEKFLEAEEDAQSSKRSSYASIITLTDKTQQDSSDSSSAPTLLLDYCPLHKYFFGSSIIELSSEADIMTVKKEEEASLSEDLKASDKKRGNKAQFAKNFMKKMLKTLNSNSKSKTHHAPNGGPTPTHESAASSKNKFPKVLKMFKKKVHPERYSGEKGAEKDENNRAIPVLRSRSDTGANIWFRQMITPEEEEEEEQIMRTSESGRGGAFVENNEHWIKTDADYLVLEL